MRALLRYSLVFGRLAIPVGLASTHVEGDVAFRTLHAECRTPVRMRHFCATCERVLDEQELLKGAEVAPGQLVLLELEELAARVPEDTRLIELVGFAPADEVDPLEYDAAYYLAPAKEALMRRPYALLAQALAETATVGLARLTAWESERIAVVRPLAGGALALHFLRPLEDRVNPGPLEEQLAEVELAEDEVDLATELILRLVRSPLELGPSRKRARLRALVEDKLAGREIVRVEQAGAEAKQAPAAPVELDLAGALRASIRDTKPRPKKRKRKTPAKA